MSALDWIGVALLGGCGAVLRVTVGTAVARSLSSRVSDPVARGAAGTFVINISGAFLLGLVNGLALSGNASLLVGTATLGAYTTYSTWMLQTRTLSRSGLGGPAYLNVALSVLAGFIAVCLGRAIGTLL